VREVGDDAVAYFLSIINLEPPKNIFVFALADDSVDFDSVIPWFESWRPSQKVRSLPIATLKPAKNPANAGRPDHHWLSLGSQIERQTEKFAESLRL
jgi:hypothetical protein